MQNLHFIIYFKELEVINSLTNFQLYFYNLSMIQVSKLGKRPQNTTVTKYSLYKLYMYVTY